MNADIKGALEQLNRSYKAFEHKGRRMTKQEVKKVLEYGLEKGYKHTGQLSDEEVDTIIKKMYEPHYEKNTQGRLPLAC